MQSVWSTWIIFILSVPLHSISGGKNVLGKKEIHLAGIFPINGVEGWQGGQVRLDNYFRNNYFNNTYLSSQPQLHFFNSTAKSSIIKLLLSNFTVTFK